MDDSTTSTAPTPETESVPVTHERTIERLVPVETTRRRWLGPFLAGVLTTLLAVAIGIGVFLLVSDADDDGNIELEVPAVDLDVDG